MMFVTFSKFSVPVKMEARIEELCQRANHVADQIAESRLTRLWYVYDALSAELYQMVMWYNLDAHAALIITQDYNGFDQSLCAEDHGRVFNLCHYVVI